MNFEFSEPRLRWLGSNLLGMSMDEVLIIEFIFIPNLILQIECRFLSSPMTQRAAANSIDTVTHQPLIIVA